MSAWSPVASFVPGPPPYDQVPAGQPKFPRKDLQQRDRREEFETRIVQTFFLYHANQYNNDLVPPSEMTKMFQFNLH
jgi:hypothetical protein